MRLRKRRRVFVDLRPLEVEPGPATGGLFLGRFDAASLRRELKEAGILAALAARGHGDVDVRTAFESGEHRVRVVCRGGRVSLVDLRLAEETTVTLEALMRRFGLDILSFLAVHWVSLQDPRGRFTAERPRLPGQRHAGLGFGRRLHERLLAWAAAWGKDGLLAFPEYLHNAVFYSSSFRFLSPGRQGRFEALWRDLAALGVAAASWAVEQERVLETPGERVVAWEPGEMAAAVSEGLRAYLDSRDYRRAADAAKEAVRFRVLEPPAGAAG